MVCSHCKQAGHTYRKCPTITPGEKEAKANEIKLKKDLVAERRRLREERRRLIEKKALENKKVSYNVVNTTDHEVVLYWGMNNGQSIHRFSYCPSHNTTEINVIKYHHRIIAIPFLEVSDNNTADAIRIIQLSENSEVPFKSAFDMQMKDFDGSNIVLDFEYNPPKTELDRWKETALKSNYLLKEIEKMTAQKKENIIIVHEKYEPISHFIDMIQDIKLPEHTEVDKELAGIPSTLTNIT